MQNYQACKALTSFRLNINSNNNIYLKSPISILGMVDIPREKKAKLFANSGDPDQTPYSAASDLGLHYLPITLLGASILNSWAQLFKALLT